MAIRREKAGCLMVLSTHVISLPRSHTKRTPLCHSRQKIPLLSFPTLVIGNPEFFLAGLFLHWASDNDSKVMLAWSKEYDSLIEPWGKTVLTGFPLKTAGMTGGAGGYDREGPAGCDGGAGRV